MSFYVTHLTDLDKNTDLLCPSCKEKSKASEWKDIKIACKKCGFHDGNQCPHCNYKHDPLFYSVDWLKA